MMPRGYGGKILRVNLSNRDIRIEKTDIGYMLKTIGGRGCNSQRLFDELDFDADPLSPENMLVFGIGPLTGTLLSASAFTTISAKSPLTGILGDSAAGGFFGPELKQAGFDQVIITGKSEHPCYLFVTEEYAEIRDASHIWGKDIWQTTSVIRKELNDNAVQVAAIGPAGENLVRFATVACNNSRMFGRTGMGAVLGSKNLKALVVRGKKGVRLHDPLTFLKLCKELDEKIISHPEYADRRNLGSTLLMKALNNLGILPTNHFQEGLCDYVDDVSGESLARNFKTKNKSCFNCNIHCSRYYLTRETEGEGPEYETLCSYTSRIGVDDLKFALRMTSFLNKMGVDSLSSGETIGWAMECVQRGLLDKNDFDGLDFTWGNKETIEKLLPMIVNREGIGDLFAEGTRALSEHFQKGTRDYALHVKGLDMICGDPRGIKAFGLTYAIASRGGDHLRAEPFFELTNRFEEAEKRFGTRDAGDRLADNGKADLVVFTEKQALLTDCMTMCKNIGLSMDIIDFDFASRLLTSATGLKFTEDRVVRSLEGIIETDRLMNIKFGIDPSQDTLPKRFTEEPLAQGPSKGQVVPVEKMVKEYYRLKGWDKNGVPARKK
ncbi:aldehyde ferredoxin oxidoreductase family protein [Desulfococcaceae bacterium HSG8]|nr:aldehyde ferredoxin oxidoreductase family protein [Desulfococcaceae bacterium HSG8]